MSQRLQYWEEDGKINLLPKWRRSAEVTTTAAGRKDSSSEFFQFLLLHHFHILCSLCVALSLIVSFCNTCCVCLHFVFTLSSSSSSSFLLVFSFISFLSYLAFPHDPCLECTLWLQELWEMRKTSVAQQDNVQSELLFQNTNSSSCFACLQNLRVSFHS